MFDFFAPAPQIRPSLNIGCLFDIPTGHYHIGKHGESILNGGLMWVTGIGGRGNTYKSTIAHFQSLSALNRYSHAMELFYDSEPPSISEHRLVSLSKRMENISDINIFDAGRAKITDGIVTPGNKWFEGLKEVGNSKTAKENIKKFTLTTPFIDKDGKNITMLSPSLFEIDSLSAMPFDSVDAIYNKNEVGDSGMNVEAMKSAAAKAQMLKQFPVTIGRGGHFVICTAHMGDDIVMDPYVPPQKKLAFLKNKLKFKGVPEGFTFLTHNLWITISASTLAHDNTKAPLYPRSSNDDIKGDTDLQMIVIQNLRAKNGPSGMPFEIIVSQSEGVLVGLTEFNYIKAFDRFGLGGNLQNFFLELLPDVNLSRTTIRGKIDENAQLRRALEITSEMCQIFNYDRDLEDKYFITPKDLYAKVKEKGYDWNILLEHTRGYWIPEEATSPLQFLSTLDLLKIAKDEYKIWWYDDYVKSMKK